MLGYRTDTEMLLEGTKATLPCASAVRLKLSRRGLSLRNEVRDELMLTKRTPRYEIPYVREGLTGQHEMPVANVAFFLLLAETLVAENPRTTHHPSRLPIDRQFVTFATLIILQLGLGGIV